MTTPPDLPGVEETASAPSGGPPLPTAGRPGAEAAFSLEAAARDTLRAFPIVMARLAE